MLFTLRGAYLFPLHHRQWDAVGQLTWVDEACCAYSVYYRHWVPLTVVVVVCWA